MGHLLTNEKILSSLRSGDKVLVNQGFTALYQTCYDVVESFIEKNSGTKEQAADIFQDALIVFYGKVRDDNFELSCAVKTYIFSISRNLWLKELRKNKRYVTLNTDQDHIAIKEDSLDVLYQTEKEQQIANLIGQLDEGCQQILKLYYFDRLKMKKIAEIMNLSSDQVAKNKKSSCLKKLRNLLKKLGGSDELRNL